MIPDTMIQERSRRSGLYLVGDRKIDPKVKKVLERIWNTAEDLKAWNTVYVQRIVKTHPPLNHMEIYGRIEDHAVRWCPDCKMKAKMRSGYENPFVDWTDRLFQHGQKGKVKPDYDSCKNYLFQITTISTWNGYVAEQIAWRELEKRCGDMGSVIIGETDIKTDFEDRVDFMVSDIFQPVCGIQVKPDTFRLIKPGTVNFPIKKKNNDRHKKLEYPVTYLYYVRKDEKYFDEQVMEHKVRLKLDYPNLNDVVKWIQEEVRKYNEK